MMHPANLAHGKLATKALSLWLAAHTARTAHATRDTAAHCDALTRIDDMRRLPAPPSFHRARRSALASLTGTIPRDGPPAMAGPRPARDVPAGTSWAFPGLPLSAYPLHVTPDTDPPPAAA